MFLFIFMYIATPNSGLHPHKITSRILSLGSIVCESCLSCNLVSICDKSWFLMFVWPNLTQPMKKVHWATPFRRTSMGVDGNVRVFPADSGFHRSGAPERRNPTQTQVVPYHMYTSVLCVSNVQESTPRCDRHHRLQFLSTKCVDLQLKTPVPGETGAILCRFVIKVGFSCSYGLT